MLENHGPLLADRAIPGPFPAKYTLVREALTVLAAAAFISLMAQIRIPLPFTPVPITGQTLAVLLVGACLGSRRGGISVLVYLLEGSLGLPVFAGFMSGVFHLLGPTGGYLFGFLPGACLVGILSERGWDKKWHTNLISMLLGSLVIYFSGVAWLGLYVGFDKALILGFFPFIPGDLIKILLAASLLPLAWKIIRPSAPK